MISSADRLLVLLLFHLSTCKVSSVPSSFVKSSFVPPASPNIVTHSNKIPSHTHINQLITAYGLSSPSPLFAKNKKRGVLSSTTKGAKIQVRLLKYVEGTGSIGDIVMVAPAFFENKLKKTNSAVFVSDEDVAKMKEEKNCRENDLAAGAMDMKEHLEGFELVLKKKSGPEGHLFGGVGAKLILKELKKQFPSGALDGKQVKITRFEDRDGVEVKHDIKELGSFKATISLSKNVSTEISVEVLNATD